MSEMSCEIHKRLLSPFRLSLQPAWRSGSGSVASSGSVAVESPGVALTALLPPLSGTPSQAFPTSSGGAGGGPRGGSPRSAAICRAVAGKRCGPLFSPPPPVVTNPTESTRESRRGRGGLAGWVGVVTAVSEMVRSAESEDGQEPRCQVITAQSRVAEKRDRRRSKKERDRERNSPN